MMSLMKTLTPMAVAAGVDMAVVDMAVVDMAVVDMAVVDMAVVDMAAAAYPAGAAVASSNDPASIVSFLGIAEVGTTPTRRSAGAGPGSFA
jgi:hypothetical protein